MVVFLGTLMPSLVLFFGEVDVIGQTVSHYKILEKPGEDGRGICYCTHNVELDCDVALKSTLRFPSTVPIESDAVHARFILISLLILLVSCWLCGQETKRARVLPDSAVRMPLMQDFLFFEIPARSSVPPSFQYGLYSFSDMRGPRGSMEAVPLSVTLPWDQSKLCIETMWHNSLYQERKYELLWTVLGSMEMGGAAYIAYRHIKKYGLW